MTLAAFCRKGQSIFSHYYPRSYGGINTGETEGSSYPCTTSQILMGQGSLPKQFLDLTLASWAYMSLKSPGGEFLPLPRWVIKHNRR